jgi:hypothetical protein
MLEWLYQNSVALTSKYGMTRKWSVAPRVFSKKKLR